jgi:hypothetical protein
MAKTYDSRLELKEKKQQRFQWVNRKMINIKTIMKFPLLEQQIPYLAISGRKFLESNASQYKIKSWEESSK